MITTFISDFDVPESVILSYSFQSLRKAGTSTRVPENSNNKRLLTQVWEKQLMLLTLLYIYIGFIAYLYCLLHITWCMESFLIRNLSTLRNVKESLRGFPQKVSPPSFLMFFKASKTKEIFWACIKFKSLSTFKLHQCVRYTHDYSIYSFCEVQLQIYL